MSDHAALIEALEGVFLRIGSNDDASHDLHHCRRVRAAALEIAALEGGADLRVLSAAAYLHDVVNLPKNSPDPAQASARSAEVAARELPALGFDAAG